MLYRKKLTKLEKSTGGSERFCKKLKNNKRVKACKIVQCKAISLYGLFARFCGRRDENCSHSRLTAFREVFFNCTCQKLGLELVCAESQHSGCDISG